MAARAMVVMVPSLEHKKTLGLHVRMPDFKQHFDPVLGDARLVAAQAAPFKVYSLTGSVLLPKGVDPDLRAHPRGRALPVAGDRVTLLDVSDAWAARPTFRVVTRLMFVRAVAAFDGEAASTFDDLVRDGGLRTWPAFGCALSWPLEWQDEKPGGLELVAAVVASNQETWGSEDGTDVANEASASRESDAAELRAIRAELESLRRQLATSESARRVAELEARIAADRRASQQDGMLGLGVAVLGGAILSRR